jgi:hypothetical protein
VRPADVRDRDGGVLLLSALFSFHPFLNRFFAGGGYQEPQFSKAQRAVLPHLSTEIGERSGKAKGFEVLLRRSVMSLRSMLPNPLAQDQGRS